MILGTAGHIDHGKTALVRALTGVDTDRLPEEKRRGITIDLGFAPLRLGPDLVLGVVDVPGHEAFVRTMLAGASGIDLAMLVVAADEGPMPQTREHLAILELLHVPRLVVALTKTDLVDAEWLALVTEDVRDLLKPTRHAAAEIIPVSAVTGQGIDQLRVALTQLAESQVQTRGRLLAGTAAAGNGVRAAENGSDLFRLPIDRSFSVKGTGTVVTGTVWSGSLTVDANARIMTEGGAPTARVRGLQTHGESVKSVRAGQRAAIALAGVEHRDIGRGAMLVTNAAWQAALVLRADVTLLPDAPGLRPRTRVRFHLGTSDVGARVVAAGSPVAPGATRSVRVVLDEPIAARAGDRFVLRSASPLATIGGGVVTDPHATRRAKPFPRAGLEVAERLAYVVEESGLHGVAESSLPVRFGVPPAGAKALVKTPGLVRLGDRLYAERVLAAARDRIVTMVAAHHQQQPLQTGAPRSEVQSRLAIEQGLFDQLVASLVAAKRLDSSGAELRTPGWKPALSGQQQQATDELLAAIEGAGHEPPSVSELQPRFGPATLSLLRHLERSGRVVQVEDARYYSVAAVGELLRTLEARMAGRGEVAPTELREALGFSRKFLIPFLEYCDRKGYTQRQGSGRVWKGRAP